MTDEQAERIFDNINTTPAVVRRLHWKRWAAVASVLLITGMAAYFMVWNKPSKTEIGVALLQDVKAPDANRAQITLADGSTVYLDSADTGQLAQQGNIKLVKLANGQIAYQNLDGQIIEKPIYNTLTNPRGSKVIDMQLADGSHVWLNAGSSINYPVAFIEKDRKVSITGEAYFEIAVSPNLVKGGKKQKFFVLANGITTEVLGTHFNVNAYDDEPAIKVTLLEGSVRVSNSSESKIIIPGQQVSAEPSSPLTVKSVDVDEVMAWKNGEFLFGDKADITTVMRQLSRWYNVKVEYKGAVKGHIGGSISRDVSLSKVLEMMEKTGVVKFKIEENMIIVMP